MLIDASTSRLRDENDIVLSIGAARLPTRYRHFQQTGQRTAAVRHALSFPMGHSRRFASALLACLTTCIALPGAQSSAPALGTDLLGKTYFLRCLCSGDDLHFRANGKSTDPCTTESFTVGLLTIDKAEETASELRLTAHRVGLVFQNNLPRQVDLSQPVQGRKPHAVVLHLAPSSSGAYAVPLAAVLTTSFDDLAPDVPEAWRGFFQAQLLASATTPPPLAAATVKAADSQPLAQDEIDAEQINPMIHENQGAAPAGHEPSARPIPYPWATEGMPKIGRGGIAPPKVIRQRPASFSTQAKSMGYSGKCRIKLIVDEHGEPQHPAVQIPAGLGLDEQALDSVAQYRFQPAMKDGKPVAVVLQIEVSFQVQ